MCQQTVVTHLVCGHGVEDTFPCEEFLDTGSCPSTEPKITTLETNCPRCEDAAHLEAAMKQIETDASLAAVPTTVKDPSAPKRWAKTREYFIHCGHFANVIQQEFELDDDSPEYITEELSGSCHGCCAALPWQIEQKKQHGDWNDDPWGEMQKITSPEEIRDMSGDVGPSQRPVMAVAGGSAPQTHASDEDITHLTRGAALPGARYLDYGGENGYGDTTPGKGKGIVNQPPRTRPSQPEPEPASEPKYDCDDDEAEHGTQPPPNHFTDEVDDDSSAHAQVFNHAPPLPVNDAHQDEEDSSDDEYSATLRATREHAPSPSSMRSYSRSPPHSPSGHFDFDDMSVHSGDEDDDEEPFPYVVRAPEYIVISPEDRLKHKVPTGLQLTAEGFEHWKQRVAEDARESTTTHLSRRYCD
ncbi:hypothetical protein MMC11_005580 [Xylographa trunciseda]|nr:hypothetical protein [Xylographa trunciseda]